MARTESLLLAGNPLFIVDDDDAVRESLAALLSSHGYRVFTFNSARDFLADFLPAGGGCLIADIRMPDMDGLELQAQTTVQFPKIEIVMMTGHADVPVAVRAMKAGAVDFVEKPFTEAQIAAAVRRAFDRVGRTIPSSASPEMFTRLASLTPREREVLSGLVAGLPNKTIGYDLGISPRTVEVHRARVMEKMHARSLPDLVRIALSVGVQTP